MLLKRKDRAVLLGLSLAFAGVATVVSRLGGTAATVALSWLTFTAIAALLLAFFRRMRQLFDCQLKEQADIYHQIEAYVALYSTLKIRQPLPPMRGWAVSPDFANVLVGVIRECRPRRILELGGGVSTLLASYCLEELGAGTIVSLDHDAEYADATRRNLIRHGLERKATVVHAPLKAVAVGAEQYLWYDCNALPSEAPFDLLIVDGPPAETQAGVRYPALPLLVDRLGPNAVILVDDAERGDEQCILLRWLREFPEFVREDVRTEKGATLLRRRGEKLIQARSAA